MTDADLRGCVSIEIRISMNTIDDGQVVVCPVCGEAGVAPLFRDLLLRRHGIPRALHFVAALTPDGRTLCCTAWVRRDDVLFGPSSPLGDTDAAAALAEIDRMLGLNSGGRDGS